MQENLTDKELKELINGNQFLLEGDSSDKDDATTSLMRKKLRDLSNCACQKRRPTPLHKAVERKDEAAVRCLGELYPYALFIKDGQDRFPIDIAKRNDSSEKLRSYLEKKQRDYGKNAFILMLKGSQVMGISVFEWFQVERQCARDRRIANAGRKLFKKAIEDGLVLNETYAERIGKGSKITREARSPS